MINGPGLLTWTSPPPSPIACNGNSDMIIHLKIFMFEHYNVLHLSKNSNNITSSNI